MRVLLVLSAFLAASHAAPQFVFVLPQGFQQLGQEGTAPEIKPLNFDFSAATAAAEAAPAQEAEVAAAEGEAEATAAAAAALHAEAAGVVDPAAAAEAEVALETPAEAVSPIADATLAEETALAEEVAAEGAPAAEVALVEVIPSENEIVAEAVVAVVEPDVAKDAPVEEQAVAMGKSLVAAVEPVPVVAEVPVPVKVSPAPAVNQVDPLAIVDPRYRQFIYQNDAPDVVAAKIELFRVHANRIPVTGAVTA